MKKISNYISVGLLVAIVVTSFTMAFADSNKNFFRGWIRSGSEVKFIDKEDANTNIGVDSKGNAIIRGGKITSINGSTLVISSALGSSNLIWTVNTNSNTKLESKNQKAINLSDTVVGDTVTVKGTMNSGSTLNMTATLVRDVSRAFVPVVNDSRQTFEGKLTSISTSSLPSTLTVMIGNSPVTVNLTASTIILGNNWLPISLGTIAINDNIRIFGYVPTGTNYITAIVVRDTNR